MDRTGGTKMKRQLIKMVYHGVYTVVHDDSDQHNPYKIIYKANGKQKQLIKYADYLSAMLYLTNIVRE